MPTVAAIEVDPGITRLLGYYLDGLLQLKLPACA